MDTGNGYTLGGGNRIGKVSTPNLVLECNIPYKEGIGEKGLKTTPL